MTDWAEAGRVAGIGFGIVFAVLVLLALAIRALGLAVGRWGGGTRDSQPEQSRKEG